MKPKIDASGPGVRHKLQVYFDTHECEVAAEELRELADQCDALAVRVGNFPKAELRAYVERNRRSNEFAVKLTLLLSTETLVASDHDPELGQAFGRALDGLERAAEGHLEKLEGTDVRQERGEAAKRQPTVEAGPLDENALAAAAAAKDYAAFRGAVAPYEEWLRLRAGRRVERDPEAQVMMNRDFDVLDLMEGTFLAAFENYEHRQQEVPFHEWLEGLIDPTVRAFVRDPYHERENVNMARSACAAVGTSGR
jgi:ribosome-associated translation inhibitor RaiA